MLKIFRITLLVFNGFLALTAIGGGIGLIAGFGAPPIDLLQGSIFSSYLLPGLVLLLLVGGSSSAAFFFVVKKKKYGLQISLIAALFIIIFELVEVFSIGSPEGAGRNLQVMYFAVGIVIGVLSIILLRLEKKSNID